MGFTQRSDIICLTFLTGRDARDRSLIRFAGPVTDSFSEEMEVQRKRELLGLKFDCDRGMDKLGCNY